MRYFILPTFCLYRATTLLASTGQSGRLRLWDVENGEELYNIDGQITDGTVWTTGVTFNQAGDLLIYGYADEFILLGVPNVSSAE